MRAFRDVGDEILRRWRMSEFDERAFPELVTDALHSARLHTAVELNDIADWLLGDEPLPLAAVSKTFSDAGFCVYHHPKFVMEILTWLDASTAIHQHNFSGAFQVLVGSSLHTHYAFEPHERISEKLVFGDLRRSELESLGSGDLSPIRAGAGFIHRLFHLERPSLSLVVRTFVQGAQPQYAYVEPGIAYDPFQPGQDFEQKVKMLRVLMRLEDPRFLDRVRELIRSLDMHTAFFLVYELGTALYERGYAEVLIPALQARFGERASMVEIALMNGERFSRITRLRRRVSDPEHRFFLALLLNAADRNELFRAVKTRYPDRDAHATVVGWLRDLSGVAGFFEFSERGLDFLSVSMRCTSFEETCRTLSVDGSRDAANEEAALEELFHGFRNSILEPLLV